jgi:V8-like Glu-specific endopeptidase
MTNDRYPYMISMRGVALCGGVLIAPDIVLTAAHVRRVLR